jgi:hypothetical protein
VFKQSRADRYKYADLSTVLDAVREPLLANGLVVSQTFSELELVTTLWHVSGESIESRMTLPSVETRGLNAAQAMGSAISYARRYSLLALLNLAAEDDDGASSGPARPAASIRSTPVAPARTAVLSPTEEIMQLQQRLGLPTAAVVQSLEAMGHTRVAELSPDELEALKTRLLDLADTVPV